MAKLEDVLKKPVRTEEKHPKRTIQWIHYTKLIRSAYQFYGEDDKEVIALADIIHADGSVLQNLLVRKTDADEYEIIAGHKRTLACKYLVEILKFKQYEFLPCVVVAVSDVRARWQIMSTNKHHEKTQYEIMKEIEDMKYLLENYPEEFPDIELRGRMVDRLAKEMHMSRSVVSDYQNISHNLIDQGKEAFKKQEIDKSAAVALASLPEEEQKNLLDAGNVTHSSVKEYKKIQKMASEEELPGQVAIKNVDMELEEERKKEQRENRFENWNQFLERDNYKKWSVQVTNPFAEETFYKYSIDETKIIVVRNYKTELAGSGGEAEMYYLCEEGKHLADCVISKMELKAYLRRICNEEIK